MAIFVCFVFLLLLLFVYCYPMQRLRKDRKLFGTSLKGMQNSFKCSKQCGNICVCIT